MLKNNKWLKEYDGTLNDESIYICAFQKEIQQLLALQGFSKIRGDNREILDKLLKEIPSIKHFYQVVLRVNDFCHCDKSIKGSFNKQLIEKLLHAIGIDAYQKRNFDSVKDPVLYFNGRFAFFDPNLLYENSLYECFSALLSKAKKEKLFREPVEVARHNLKI